MLKVAVVPEKEEVAIGVPLADRVTLVIFAGFPVPFTINVRLVMLTVEPLGLDKTACWTVTPEAPESWLELGGGLVPWVADTVTWVGVEEGVEVGEAVFTRVLVGVAVAVNVGVRVTVEVAVLVAVWVAVFTRVLVGVEVVVAVGVLVGVRVVVLVAVAVTVLVGVAVAVLAKVLVGV